VPAPLRELMMSLDGIAEVIATTGPLPHFDLHCPLLSLPLAFGTRLETVPSKTPYLKVSHENVQNWNRKLAAEHRPRIGVAWSGSTSHDRPGLRVLRQCAVHPNAASREPKMRRRKSEEAPWYRGQRSRRALAQFCVT
jgi:hypothetical protein